MKPKVYVETSVVSYIAARRTSQIIAAAMQNASRVWWDEQGPKFDLFISAAVIDEASAGDPKAAARRLQELEGVTELDISVEAATLAEALIEQLPLPKTAEVDAVHIAVATINGMDYLLTWNCTHISNPTLRLRMEQICESAGYDLPTICSPLQLIGDSNLED